MKRNPQFTLQGVAQIAGAIALADALGFQQGLLVGFSGAIGLIWGLLGFIYLEGKELKLNRLKAATIWAIAASLSICFIAGNNFLARSRAEKLVWVIETFQKENGHLPNSLNDLVPTCLSGKRA